MHRYGCIFDKKVARGVGAPARERLAAQEKAKYHNSNAAYNEEKRVPAVRDAKVRLNNDKNAQCDNTHFFRHDSILILLLALDNNDKLSALFFGMGNKIIQNFLWRADDRLLKHLGELAEDAYPTILW